MDPDGLRRITGVGTGLILMVPQAERRDRIGYLKHGERRQGPLLMHGRGDR